MNPIGISVEEDRRRFALEAAIADRTSMAPEDTLRAAKLFEAYVVAGDVPEEVAGSAPVPPGTDAKIAPEPPQTTKRKRGRPKKSESPSVDLVPNGDAAEDADAPAATAPAGDASPPAPAPQPEPSSTADEPVTYDDVKRAAMLVIGVHGFSAVEGIFSDYHPTGGKLLDEIPEEHFPAVKAALDKKYAEGKGEPAKKGEPNDDPASEIDD